MVSQSLSSVRRASESETSWKSWFTVCAFVIANGRMTVRKSITNRFISLWMIVGCMDIAVYLFYYDGIRGGSHFKLVELGNAL